MTPNEPEKRSRGPQPDGLFISASEALTWLAFGVPEKQAWRWHNVAERLRRRIGVQAL